MKKFRLHTLTLALALACGILLGDAAAAGQNANSNSAQNSNGNMSAGATVSNNDRKFMQTAAAGGMSEVEMARLALERGSSDAVKQFAQKMIDDHTANNQELMQLASSKGVTLPAGPDARHRAMMEKMSKLSGADFDHQYIMNAGVKDHQKMLKLLQDETRKGRDADVKAFAAKTVPAVEMHLKMARDMMSGMGHSSMKSGM